MYILPTIHLMKHEDYPLPRPVIKAMESSRIFWLEADPAARRTQEYQQRVVLLGMLPQDTTLSQVLPAELSGSFRKQVQAIGLQPTQFERFRPWLAGMSLAMVRVGQAGFDWNVALDSHVQEFALIHQKELRFLESPQTQLNLMSKLSREQEIDLFQQSLANVTRFEQQSRNLLEAWRLGDMEAMRKETLDGLKDAAAFSHIVLDQRSQAWSIQLIAHLKVSDTPSMVVVPGSHLGGPYGLNNAIQQAGYAVRAVPVE